MNIPVYYDCKKCEGQFPKKDYNFKAELCTTCDDLIKREQSIRDAAPELLEMLKEAVERCEINNGEGEEDEFIEMFNDAINKAEGTS